MSIATLLNNRKAAGPGLALNMDARTVRIETGHYHVANVPLTEDGMAARLRG